LSKKFHVFCIFCPSPSRNARGTLILPAAGVLAAQPAQTKPIDPANIDTTCAPCRDFALFANGGWLKHATIPGDQPTWGSFNELQDADFSALHTILDSAASQARTTKRPNTRKLGPFYASCMDSTSIEAAGSKLIEPELKRIGAIRSRRDGEGEAAEVW
jgi:putative endopeptidase